MDNKNPNKGFYSLLLKAKKAALHSANTVVCTCILMCGISCGNQATHVPSSQTDEDSLALADTVPTPQRIGIKMTKSPNGVYLIPCLVNGVKMDFVFDTGASNVCISLTEAIFLKKNGYISKDDIGGDVNTIVADGSITTATKLRIKTIEIGGIVLRNVDALVSSNLDAPLLLGQSAIQKMGTIQMKDDSLFITGIVEHPQVTSKEKKQQVIYDMPPAHPKVTIWDKLVALFGYEGKVEQLCIHGWNAYKNDMPELALSYCSAAIDCCSWRPKSKRSWKSYAFQAKIYILLERDLDDATTLLHDAISLNKNRETFYLSSRDRITYIDLLISYCYDVPKSRLDLTWAIDLLQENVILDPHDVNYMNMLSYLYAMIENYEYAVKWANKLVQIDAETGYFRLAWIEHDREHFDSAISYYQKVLDINPNCAAALHNIGIIYCEEYPYKNRYYQQGISYWKEAAQLGNKSAQKRLESKGIKW